jgi:hypothetical protein
MAWWSMMARKIRGGTIVATASARIVRTNPASIHR